MIRSISNRKNRILLLLVVFVLQVSFVQGQSLKAFIKAAENSFIEKDYYSALDYYSNAIEFDTTSAEINYKVGESARLFSAYNEAEERYEAAVNYDENKEFPLSQFWLANMQQQQGKYTDAKRGYEMYLSEHSGDDAYYTQRAEKELKACEWALDKIANPDGSITITHLDGGINTQYSEFGAMDSEEGLYYSSLSFSEVESENNPSKLLSKVLLSGDKSSQGDILGDANKEKLHSAHTAFNKDKSRMYYTICDYFLGNDIKCELYYKNISTTGDYSEEIKLPENINLQSYTTTQPAVGYDSKLDQDLLFFVTDKVGGAGKLDIWYSVVGENGNFGEPINAKEINSPEDDITPFYHNPSNVLYFSSNGRQSLGGHDVYRADKGEMAFEEPTHLNNPINTSYNDVYYTLSDDGKESYFSSDRLESSYVDNPYEACCYDIYKAEHAEVNIKLNAQTFIKATQDSLINANVRVVDISTGEVVCEELNATGIDHHCILQKDREYMVIGEKYGMQSDTIYVSTKGIYESQDIVKKLFLGRDKIAVNLDIVDDKTGAPLENATVTIVDLSDPSNPDKVLENVNGKASFDLDPNKKYKIIIEAEGYDTQTMIIDGKKDGLGGEINKTVRMKKRDLNIYLPLALYFDNDYPKLESRAVVSNKSYFNKKRLSTSKTYTDTYTPFISKKEKYKDRSVRNLQGEERLIEQQNMDDFFEFDVRGGFEKMGLFLDALLSKLNGGQNFEIQIKGFASPIAGTNYNLELSKRRVHSVENELDQFSSGQLNQFIENGRLIITDVSFGENQAPANVSDSASNVTASIYSVAASKERRVEIININETSSF